MATNASINCSFLHKLLSTVAGGAVGVINNWKSGTLNIRMREKERQGGKTIQNIKNYFQFLVNVLLCEFMNAKSMNAKSMNAL